MRGNFYASQESGINETNNNSAVVNDRAEKNNNGGNTAGGVERNMNTGGYTAGGPILSLNSAQRMGMLGNGLGLHGIREIGGG